METAKNITINKPTARPPRLKLLFSASECVPFVKTGGLADVAGALPKQLARGNAVDVRVIMPRYKHLWERFSSKMTHLTSFYVDMGWRSQFCGIETMKRDGVTYYFVDNEYYFGREYIYGGFNTDEGERFAFFSKAILEAMQHIDFFPDVLHLNDWQTGMAAALHKMQYSWRQEYANIKTVFTIHNLRYQGVFDKAFMDELLTLGPECNDPNLLEYSGCINFLKAGLVYSDAITTVSPSYANEIQTPYYGETLDGVLRARSNVLHGILNGIDNSLYNPETEVSLPAHFSALNLDGKAQCKAALQKELGLAANKDVPVVAIVSRMTDQKGFDLIERVVGEIMEMDLQLAVLGTGDERYEGLFSWASWRYGERVAARTEYNESLAHRIYAGADIFLMPSHFEPCGLAQMIAMRYGTLPLVRETGGLRDTVQPFNQFEDTGTGFTFTNYNAHELLFTLQRAIHYYYDEKEIWTRMMRRAMAKDFSWAHSAKEYKKLYRMLKDEKA